MILPQYGYAKALEGLNELSREMLSFTFLHNNLLWPAYIPASPVYDFWERVEIPFGMGDSDFHPYWCNGIISEPECVKVSYWKKRTDEAYLVAVANWSSQSVTASIVLPFHLSSCEHCYDAETEEAMDTGESWGVTVGAHNLRVFRLARE